MSSFPLSENLSRLWASLIVDELYKNGAKQFYCAPGMRNAPILASCHHHPEIDVYSFVDERALSYRALGSSKSSNKMTIPVLNCTSGTAMANFLPAIIEGHRSNNPLIILTADRPIELVKTDANQTIDQTRVINGFCVETLNLEAPSTSLSPCRLRTLIASTVAKAQTSQRPVHINLPLREPLNGADVYYDEAYKAQALLSFKNTSGLNRTLNYHNFTESDEVNTLFKDKKSPLLVIGKLNNSIEKKKYITLLKTIGIPKYLDVTSGIKYHFGLEDKINPTFDHPEVYEAHSKTPPDLIIHIGERLVSKHYYRFQEENPDIPIIHIVEGDSDHDPGFSNNLRLNCDPLSFLTYLAHKKLNTNSPILWPEFIKNKQEIINNGPLSFAYISKSMIEYSPSNLQLLVANSTAIRSFDNFVSLDETFNISTYSNRGVSGIEGFVATLCGIADNKTAPLALIIGDISFMHDLNSLYMLKEFRDRNITIIIANNRGGGIFELLPIAKEKDILPLLTTPHEEDFKGICESFSHLKYKQINTKEEFLSAYCNETKLKHISIIEIIIDSDKNLEVFKKLRTVKL